jgi:hypothetical protein
LRLRGRVLSKRQQPGNRERQKSEMHNSGNYVDTGEMGICFLTDRYRREWSRRESSDMDEARKGELSGESESIEAQIYVSSQRVSDLRDHANRSRREWSRRESSDIDEARKGERAGASESIEAQTRARSQRVSNSQNHRNRSRRESNPHLRFRKPLFCPLNYGNRNTRRKNTRIEWC